MAYDTECWICGSSANVETLGGGVAQFSCIRCGCFSITASAEGMINRKSLSPRQCANMSSLIRAEYNNRLIDSQDAKSIIAVHDKFPLEKLDLLLLYLYRKTEKIGDTVSLGKQLPGNLGFNPNHEAMACCWAEDHIELYGMIKMLIELGFVTSERNFHPIITAQGYKKIAELLHDKGHGERCFIAMHFNPELKPVYEEALRPGIVNAGYYPVRLDHEEHANNIIDQMLMEIRRSRFLVVDLTNNNSGAYFEAGFAKGLGIPVIWTCRDKSELHFDVAQNNCLFWKDVPLADFSVNLTRRIEAVLGHGPYTTSV